MTYGRMCRRFARGLVLTLAATSALPAVSRTPERRAADSAEVAPGEAWVRVDTDEAGKPRAMQTAVVRYRGGAAGPEVDLIGAVHVGDLAYYHALNRRFQSYDALLFELVAPKGTVVTPDRGTSNAHPVGALQNGMKQMLELEHQLEIVDYRRPNFVHADMSPEEFQKSMEDRGEGFLQLYFRLLGQGIAQQSKMAAEGESLDADILMALFSSNRAQRLKIAMSKQLCQMESMLTSLGGEEGSTLITERNKIALKVLREQIDAGKRKLGVFYGAGHLDDMDKRLKLDFGLKPVAVEWIDAWDLTK